MQIENGLATAFFACEQKKNDFRWEFFGQSGSLIPVEIRESGMTEFGELLMRSGLSYSEAAAELGVADKTVKRYASGLGTARARDLQVMKGLIPTGVRP